MGVGCGDAPTARRTRGAVEGGYSNRPLTSSLRIVSAHSVCCQARDLWEKIVVSAGQLGEHASVWLEYIQLERRMACVESSTDVDEYIGRVHSLFTRACRAVSDDATGLCSAWLAWEREEGSLKSKLIAEGVCKAKYVELQPQYTPGAQPVAAAAAVEPKPKLAGVCFAFQKGECKRGDACRFPHTGGPEAAAAVVPSKKRAREPSAPGPEEAAAFTKKRREADPNFKPKAATEDDSGCG